MFLIFYIFKKYEEEIIALEKERGEDVHFLKPQVSWLDSLGLFFDTKFN